MNHPPKANKKILNKDLFIDPEIGFNTKDKSEKKSNLSLSKTILPKKTGTTLLKQEEEDNLQKNMANFAFANAWNEDEPEYSMADLIEKNPDYEGW